MTVTLYFENYLVEIYRLWLYDDYNQDVYPDVILITTKAFQKCKNELHLRINYSLEDSS